MPSLSAKVGGAGGGGVGRSVLPDASGKAGIMGNGIRALGPKHFIPYTVMGVSKGSFLQDPA